MLINLELTLIFQENIDTLLKSGAADFQDSKTNIFKR